MEKGNILVVDDEVDLREILQFNLENVGYHVDVAASAEEALEKLSPSHSLILLDVMMEGMSGFKMAEILRNERNCHVPIIFLTAKNAERDVLKGFSAGGDDYIGKPFSINEVIARVGAVIKRSGIPAEPLTSEIRTGKIRIDFIRKMVYVEDSPVMLSKKEFEILSLLASHEGMIYSREKIMEELWKDAPYVLDRTIDVHIARIRGKLGTCKNYLTNRSGFGYCFQSLK